MSNTVAYPRGFFFNKPRPAAPDFVVGTLVVNLPLFAPWLKEFQESNWIDLELVESKEDDKGETRYGARLNTYFQNKDNRPTPNPPNNSELPSGLFVYPPSEKSPSFVKGNTRIYTPFFTEWLKTNQNDKGFIKMDLLLSKEGDKYYARLNTYIPKGESNVPSEAVTTPTSGDVDLKEYDEDDTPF